MLSRLLMVLIVLFCGVAFAKGNRLHPDSLKLPVGLLYHRGDRNVDNVLKRSLVNHTLDNSKYSFHIVKEHYTNAFTVLEKVCTLLSRGVTVIVATIPPSPTRIAYEQLSTMSNTYHIPLIIYSMPEIDEKPLQFSMTIKPSTMRASLDLMQYYGWKNVIYIKDERTDSGRFQKELESRSSPYNFTIDVILETNAEPNPIASLLLIQENMTSEELHVVLNTAPDVSKDVVLGYTRQQINKRIHFLIVEPFIDSSWAETFEHTNLKLTTFNLMDFNNREFQLPKGKNASPINTLLSAEAGAVLGVAFERLYKLNSDVFNYVAHNTRGYLDGCPGSPAIPLIHGLAISLEIKRNVTVKGYTGNLEFDIHGRRRNYALGVTEITSDGNIEIGTWSDRAGLKMHLQMSFPIQHITPELPEKRYIVTSILEQPYLAIQGNGYVGFCKDLINILSNRLNFKYDLKLVDDRHYGSYNNNTGKWSGMIGEIVNGKADMAMAPLMMTSRRSLAVEFTVPFQDHGITLLLKNSKETPSLCYLVFRPFTWQLWIFIFSVYIVFGILYILIYRYTDLPKRQREYDEDVSHWNTRSWPLRMLLLVCLMFTVMILSMYIANLGTILSHQQSSWPNAKRLDFKDVFKKSVLTGTPKMLLLRYGSIMAFFQRSKNPLYRMYWNQVAADPSYFVTTYQEGIQRVLESDGDTAIFIDSAAGEYLSNENCDLQITSGFLNVRSYAIALRSDHPLRRSLNKAILALRENESLDNLYAKWWKSKCPYSHNTENRDPHGKPIELMEMDGLFYMLTAGFGLIVLTTAIKLFCQKRRTSAQSDSSTSLYYKQSL